MHAFFPECKVYVPGAARFGGRAAGGKRPRLSPIQQFVMFRWRLCHGTSTDVLAILFDVSPQQVSDIFNRYVARARLCRRCRHRRRFHAAAEIVAVAAVVYGAVGRAHCLVHTRAAPSRRRP